jgi:hypothetical protein
LLPSQRPSFFKKRSKKLLRAVAEFPISFVASRAPHSTVRWRAHPDGWDSARGY